MSYVPPSCFDFTLRNSGIPVYYGGATVGCPDPNIGVHTYHRDGDIILMQPSGALHAYYAFLDTRYDTPPSGWNAPGYGRP